MPGLHLGEGGNSLPLGLGSHRFFNRLLYYSYDDFGRLVETIVGSVTRVLVIKIQRFSESESLEGARSDVMLNSQICNGP